MWSDRLAPSSRHDLVERLRGVLPAPAPHARTETIPLAWKRTPAEAASALQHKPGFVWLDRPCDSRLFVDPLARITVRRGVASLQGPAGTLTLPVRGFDLIEAIAEAWGGPDGALLCGYLGYELGCELEDVELPKPSPADPPDLHLGLYDRRLEHGPEGWLFRACNAWRPVVPPSREPALRPSPAAFIDPAGDVSSTPDADGFRAAVARTVDRIYNGELFQVNLCRRLETAWPGSQLWPLYLRLREISPASQGAFIRTGARTAVLSVSPELFLSVRQGQVCSRPIKGTRPRGATPEADAAFLAELQSSEKDRAELAMIVDVVRNDLGRVCLPGSVEVTRHATLLTLPTVHHTYSEVAGRLREDCGPADLLRACAPPASISGAPKIRAMQLAALEEGYRRGPCMGSIGWMALDGDMEWSVAIRTAVGAARRVWYLAGCGITAESVPQEELAESAAKAAAFLQALGVPADSRPAT